MVMNQDSAARRPNLKTAGSSGTFWRRHLRVSALFACFILLLLAGWFFDAPGRWTGLLAQRALEQHQPLAALEWVDRGRTFSSRTPQLSLLAVRAELQLNMNQRATEQLQRAIRLGAMPDVVSAYRDMIAAQRGDLDAAQRLLNQRTQAPLPSEAYEAVIRCAQYHGKLDWASWILDQIEMADALSAMVNYQRGRISEIREDFTQAAEFYGSALEAQSHMTRAAFRAGIMLVKRREFAQAADMFRRCRETPYQRIANIELANCLWEQDSLGEAMEVIASCIDDQPKQLLPLYLQVDEYVDADRAALVAARIQDALGNAEESVQLLHRVLDYNHRNFEARTLLVKNLRLLGRTEEAQAVAELQAKMVNNRQRCHTLRIQLSENPDDIEKRCELAELYWYTESIAEAELALDEILRLDPQCERAHRLRSKIDAEQAKGLVDVR